MKIDHFFITENHAQDVNPVEIVNDENDESQDLISDRDYCGSGLRREDLEWSPQCDPLFKRPDQ